MTGAGPGLTPELAVGYLCELSADAGSEDSRIQTEASGNEVLTLDALPES